MSTTGLSAHLFGPRGVALAISAVLGMLLSAFPVALRAPAVMARTVTQVAVTAGGNLDAPVGFEANGGQESPETRFVLHLGAWTAKLSDSGLDLYGPEASAALRATARQQHGMVGFRLIDANPRPRITGESRLPGVVNYAIGPDARSWHKGVPVYARVRYAGIYPGIDVLFHVAGGQLEYDFEVAPRSDPSRIRLAIAGQAPATVDAAGDLIVRTGQEAVTQ